jgi:hypothetical protein
MRNRWNNPRVGGEGTDSLFALLAMLLFAALGFGFALLVVH